MKQQAINPDGRQNQQGEPDLAQENRVLRRMLNTLTKDAAHNESVMARCQDRELALLSAEGLETLLERLTLGMQSSFALNDISLVLADPGDVLKNLMAGIGLDHLQIPHTHLVEDLQHFSSSYKHQTKPWLGAWVRNQHQSLFSGKGLRSVALLPLNRSGVTVGFLNLASRDINRFTHKHATDFLGRLATIAAVCLENAINSERLRLTGLTDALTGLYNRRYLEQQLHAEVARALRHGQSLSCLFIDADHFKVVNDDYGHAAGDAVLIALAQRVLSQLRSSDLATRFGGEELVLILPQTDEQNACQLAERIRERISSSPIQLNDGREVSITVSIGVSELTPVSEDKIDVAVRQLLEDADAAVYVAKEAGRDRVVLAGQHRS